MAWWESDQELDPPKYYSTPPPPGGGGGSGVSSPQETGSDSSHGRTISWCAEILHKLLSLVQRPEKGGGLVLLQQQSVGVAGEEEGESQVDWSWDWDLRRVVERVNRVFFPQWSTPQPFVSIHLIFLILGLGLLIGLLFLFLALLWGAMQKLRSLCPSFKLGGRRRAEHGSGDEERGLFPKGLPTPEILEARRQERLSLLQKECQNLENQLTVERTTSLTSRASDSDLEYLGYGEDTPPLKRNSISLQDIPQSVIKIRREKQLRQLKEEIEHLHALSQSQDLDKISLCSKSPLLKDLKFEYHPRSKSSSPSPTIQQIPPPTAEHLSQRISHLKAQRRLNEIRSDLESLALHHLHSDEIKAKTSSLQDIPRSALGAKRQEELLTIAKEIEHVKNYKLQQKSVLSSVLPEGADGSGRNERVTRETLAKLNRVQELPSCHKPTTSRPKSAVVASLSRQESEMSQTSGSSGIGMTPSSSIRRTRAQELNRVRVELKELSYKLNLNYVFDVEGDRQKMVPQDWPKQCSFDNSFGK